ncbi:MAG TPA: hypothetical protein VNY52_05365 [Solirubrobacteraceae bacterium]|nr:hypothetical protein [Solirubrobacteraceae bacterium]
MIASLALVFAMTGGAYAAGRVLITSTKQISPKVLKALKGNAGAPGANGAAGAAGPQGPGGAQGAGGPTGPIGPQGAKGETGPKGENGTNGTTGFTETLPKGKTLKGDWAIEANVPGVGPLEGSASSDISFGIPLTASPAVAYIPAPTEEQKEKHEFPTPPAGCSGTFEDPGAEEGHLCVFGSFEHNHNGEPYICASGNLILCLSGGGGGLNEGADPTGAVISVLGQSAGVILFSGTWAVTAE